MSLLTLCALVALGAQFSLAQNEPSYLISTPNRWIHERPEMVCIDLYNVRQRMTISLTLQTVWIGYSWNPLPAGIQNETVATATLTISPTEKSKCISMTLPGFDTRYESNTRPRHLLLTATGQPTVPTPAGYTFNDSLKIGTLGYWQNTDITFVQTDKPIYKPGQLVRIRILTLDTTLRPSYDMIDEVSIEAPNRVRVEQWNNITVTKGMVQLEFQLHSEPEQGFYKIKMRRNGNDDTEQFEVKEYVLPKYEVTIEPPKYMTFQVERVIAKVCAKYTFGQPVRGTVEGSVCAKERPQFFFRGKRSSIGLVGPPGPPGPGPQDPSEAQSYCTLVNQPLVDGCYTINVTRADVGYNRYTTYQYGVTLEIAARVKEQGTNQYLNATTETLSFQQYDIKVDIEGADKFKPGLPYNGKVIAKRLDDTPARNEPISIIINNWGSEGRYTKQYTTDSNGEVKFSIPPVAVDLASYSIQAEATAYNQSFWSYRGPSGYQYVAGWYSPSGSFLQLIPTSETLSCNSRQTFKIQYTTSQALNTQLQYQVVGLTDIVESGSNPISLTLNTAVTEPDSSDDWDLTPRPRCWYYWYRCPFEDVGQPGGPTTTTAAPRPSTDPTYITATHKGTISVNVPITAAMSTTGRLVVYYIRPDGEVVADGIDFKVEECTANNAQMTFSKSTARPGEPVNIRFSASPQSLCSYGVIDKSVFLEGGNNQLSLSKALDQIQNLALREWNRISDFDREDKCGPTPKNATHEFYWTISFKDASEGFITAGLTYMTNLGIETAPCKLNSYRSHFTVNDDYDSTHTEPFSTSSTAAPTSQSPDISLPNNENVVAFDAVNSDRRRKQGRGCASCTSFIRSDDSIVKTVRSFFPETWLWDMQIIE